jgi:putative nucleotidyltransferase with HDIG domain
MTFAAKSTQSPGGASSPAAFALRPLGREVEVLLTRACSKDELFRTHASNVAGLSVQVGETLGLPPSELETLELAAALHDVGKLEVPASIIAKPGPLDEEEWTVMRRHPVEGVRLLAPLVSSPEVLQIVRSHHERWDGTGYPDRLEGERIPLGARIVAAVDAFCAMIEPRAYRSPRSTSAACAEILAQANVQFDAACAKATYRVCAGARSRQLGRG